MRSEKIKPKHMKKEKLKHLKRRTSSGKHTKLIYSLSIILCLFIVGALLTIRFSNIKLNKTTTAKMVISQPTISPSIDEYIAAVDEPPTEKTVKITAVGDILFHQEQLDAAYNPDNKSYNFESNYTYIKNYINDADISLATCETTFAGAEYGYSGFPLFNTPSSALDSLKNIGFDILSLASNHILDVQDIGFFNSITEVKEREFDILGVRENQNEKNYLVKEVNDIKIGFTSYVFETDEKFGQKTLNSIPIPYSVNNLINTFNDQTLDSDLALMEETLTNMKNDGAEIIIFVMHWGDEYSTEVSTQQKYIANALNKYGVDVILGSHPHVVQPFEKLIDETTSKETLVFYSLGNIVSNQRLETMGNSLSADGALVQLEIVKDTSDNVSVKNYNYIPTWVHKHTDSNNKISYEILPVSDILNSPNVNTFSTDIINELNRSYESTTSIIGEINN